MEIAVGNILATIGFIAALLYLIRRYIAGGVCRNSVRLDGKTVVITGCNTGIGKETALELSRRGAKIVMVCRNMDKANIAAKEIRNEANGEVVVYQMKLDSLKSVRKCAEEINNGEEKIDILINNAGVLNTNFEKTEDGFELHMGINHLGHFLFTNLLLDKMKSNRNPCRIINVSSLIYKWSRMDLNDIHYQNKPYKMFEAYGISKLANIHFTRELSKRLKGSNITTFALHPGTVQTEISRHIEERMFKFLHKILAPTAFFFKTPLEGAQTSIYCATEPSLEDCSGMYFADCKQEDLKDFAKDDDIDVKLWDYSVKAVGL